MTQKFVEALDRARLEQIQWMRPQEYRLVRLADAELIAVLQKLVRAVGR